MTDKITSQGKAVTQSSYSLLSALVSWKIFLNPHVSFLIQVNLCVCACRYILLGVICFASPISLNIKLSPWFDTSLIINNKYILILLYSSFPGGGNGKEPACQFRRQKRHRFNPWVGKISWRRKWQPTPVFLPWESHGQGRLVGYIPWGRKESDTT